MSPWRLEDNDSHVEEIIDVLFPGDPLLCVGRTEYKFSTKPRSTWRDHLHGMQFIVPNPMSRVSGKTQDGKESEHCLDNTGPRRFLVVEFDGPSTDQQARRLRHLGQFAPLVMVVHSGGRSIHGWFFAADQCEETVHKFMRYAVAIGADHATWPRCHFVRMPDGQRDTEHPQRVYYFDPRKVRP